MNESVRLESADAADRASIVALLDAAHLPASDVGAGSPAHFVVARAGASAARASVVGAIGLERHGDTGLVRSLVVAPARRGEGLGAALVSAVERRARELGLRRLVLLTETAQAFFERLGYTTRDRDSAPADARASTQFAGLCPVSAKYLEKSIDA
jgi:N-acetylglutamate synthase-like GNAT family acetyltransferase